MLSSQLANLISLSRLVMAALLPVAATQGMTRTTVALIAMGLVSDAIDGPVARMTGTNTERGAKVDSVCDLVFYSSAILAFVIAFPDVNANLLTTWIVSVVALVVPSVVGWMKFARLPSYHTILSRVSIVGFGLALLAFQLLDITWPFRAAAVIAVISAIDDLLITLLLNEPKLHIPHCLSLLRTASVSRFGATPSQP